MRSDKWDKNEKDKGKPPKITTFHMIRIDDEFQLKGSLQVQNILVKNGFKDRSGKPLKRKQTQMGMNDKGDFAIINEGYTTFRGTDYRLETIFEDDKVVFFFGTKEELIHSKKYPYKAIYDFQKDFMKLLGSVKNDK